MFSVHVLYSEKHNKIYIGYSSDLERRLISHNERERKALHLDIVHGPVHTEAFNAKGEATKRERELKSARGRRFIWEEFFPETTNDNDIFMNLALS